jgi:hypothetical protein
MEEASSIRTCENNKKEQLSIDNGWHLIKKKKKEEFIKKLYKTVMDLIA